MGSRSCRRMSLRAFTLIEAVLAIATVTLGVAITLPILTNARRTSQLVLSMSNVRQQVLATNAYRNDYQGLLPTPIAAWGAGPYQLESRGRGFGNIATAGHTHAGKNVAARYARSNPSFDIPAGNRTLSAYFQTDLDLNRDTVSDNDRNFEIPVCRSPADRGSPYRDGGGAPGLGRPEEDRTISTYNQVGTSYLNNQWWFRGLASRLGSQGEPAFPPLPGSPFWEANSPPFLAYFRYLGRLGGSVARSRLEQPGFQASKFVFISDKTSYQFQWNTPGAFAPPAARLYQNWISEFGDRNKSVMGFLDGSMRYQELWTPRGVYPAGFVATIPNSLDAFSDVRSHIAPDYTFLLP
ncbi:MAG: type II secretion system protein [Phycisphaerales bacterium]|jgi:type II secretory pathway pseudopilin PulG